jgi:hypothetical protein
MSVTIQWKIFANSGVAISPSSVKLQDPTGTYGVRRTDTNEVILESATAMTSVGGGVYSKTFAEPAVGLSYEYYVRVTEAVGGATHTYYVHGHANGSPAWEDETTLGGVRKLLVKTSGRYDLVRDGANNDFTDMGMANMYINQAQRWLDRRLPHHKSRAKLFKTLAANDGVITFQECRFVRNVYEVSQTDSSKTLLDWATLYVGLAPDQIATAEDYDDLPDGADHVVFGEHWPHQAVYVEPSTESRTILVEAEWYCPKLEDDTDRSYWTTQHPLLLAHTASLLMEVSMRNSQGVEDYMKPVIDDLRMISNDLMAEEASGPAWHWVMR